MPTGSGNGTLTYILPDHLGSASVITSDAGAVISEMAYWPYGATRSGGITQTDKRYTGQQEEPGDAALGLYNYKARFYSTTLGRFVSADPVQGSSAGGMNRFSYALNNPLVYRDPTGMKPCKGCANFEKKLSARGSRCLISGLCFPTRKHSNPAAEYSDDAVWWGTAYGIEPSVILATLIWEWDQGAAKDLVEMTLEVWGNLSLGVDALLGEALSINWGRGNISVKTVRDVLAWEAIHGGHLPQYAKSLAGDVAIINDLLNTETAVMYMAAIFAYHDAADLAPRGHSGNIMHQAAIYNLGSENYADSFIRGTNTFFVEEWNSSQIKNVMPLIQPARDLIAFCQGVGAACERPWAPTDD